MKERLRFLLDDPKWRTLLPQLIGLGVNAVIALILFVNGCVYGSPWLIAAAVYYIVLSLISAKLMKDVHSLTASKLDRGWRRASGIRSYRLCGVMMFGLEATMSGVVVQIVWQNCSYEYPGALIYLSALYAFYCLSTAVVRVARSQKTDPPELTASNLLSVSKSLMSLLSMQTAMLARFCEEGGFRRAMNCVTGFGVCIIVLIIAAYMVIRANRELKRLSNGEVSPINQI